MAHFSSLRHVVRAALALGASLGLALSASADFYLSSGPLPFGGGQVYRLADDGSVKGAFGAMGQSIGMMWLDGDVLLVCDYGNQEARLFHADGTDLGLFASGVECISPIIDSYGNILIAEYTSGNIRRYSSTGIDLGLFANTGLTRHDQLAMDTAGNIYVSSLFSGEQTIYRYDPDGNFLGVFADSSTAPLTAPTGLAFQSDGTLLVSNTIFDSIEKLDSNGNYLGQFSNSGMFEAEWLTVLPDDSVLLPSWSGGFVEKYDAAGNDLGVFATVPHCYHILQGPEVLAPTNARLLKGKLDGAVANLAAADGVVVAAHRNATVNTVALPFTLEVSATATTLTPTAMTLGVTSRVVEAGTFVQETILVDKNGVPSPTERRTDTLSGSLNQVRLTVAGDPSSFVRADGTVKVLIKVKATGASVFQSWTYECDRVAWTLS